MGCAVPNDFTKSNAVDQLLLNSFLAVAQVLPRGDAASYRAVGRSFLFGFGFAAPWWLKGFQGFRRASTVPCSTSILL